MRRLRSLLVWLSLTMCFVFAPTFSQSIVQVIRLPGSTYWDQAWGLTADSTNLYLSSNTSDATVGRRVLKLDFSGQPIDSVILPAGVNSSQGLARDGDGNFYYLRRYTAAGTILKFSSTGVLLDSVRLPSNKFPGGLAWDGSHIWYSIYFPDAEAGLYKLNFTTHQVVDTILVPTLQPYGVAWDGTHLLYVENGFQGNPQGVFKVNPATGDTAGFIPAPVDPSGTRPNSVAWDGRYMWLLAEPVGANTGRSLYKYDLGGGGTPDINLSPSALNFGTRRVNQLTPYVDSISIQNVGTSPLRIDSIKYQPGSFFTFANTPITIPPNGSARLFIYWDAGFYGPDSASFSFVSNDPDESRLVLSISGFAIWGFPVISVPTSYDYSQRRIGSSSSWLMTIQNQGAAQLAISSITLGILNFRMDSVAFPVIVDSLQSKSLRIWFRPTAAGSYVDTLKITSNAPNGTITNVVLSGIGNSAAAPLGAIMWEGSVPNNPFTSSDDYQPTSIKQISDVNGDGVNDVIVSSGNYFVTCFNGGSSVTGDILWTFNTGYNNNNSGSVNWEDALQIRSDVNGDGVPDVVFGCGGGNEFVYTVSGRTGSLIWAYGDSIDFSRGDIQAVRLDRDYNSDGVKDVLVSASGTGSGNGGRHAAICLNGLTGAEIFNVTQPQTFTQDIVATETGGAISANNNGAPYSINGFNNTGQPVWTYTAAGTAWNLREIPDINDDGIKDIIGLQGFSGGIFAISGNSGGQLWASSLGSSNNGRIVLMDDLNHNGYIDFVLSGPQSLYRVDSKTGGIIWSIPLGSSYIRGVDRLTDVNGDSIPDIAIATQQPGKIMVLSGQNGSMLSEYVFGATITERGDRAAVLSSIDGNLSTEFVGGNRQGRIICFSGGLNTTVGVPPTTTLPTQFAVSQNYPNPFNPSTTINITLPVQSDFVLTIVDILGRKVRTLEYQRVPAGVQKIVWDGNDDKGLAVSSGMYMYQVRAGSYLDTKKLILLK